MNVKPLADRVLIEPAPAETKTRSAVCNLSFIVSEQAAVSNPMRNILKYSLNLEII